MALVTIAEGLVSNLVGKAIECLSKAAFKKAASWWGARDELKKLEDTMRLIHARVHDAERRQEDNSSGAVREWLRRLKLVLYQADDLFDEVLTRYHQKPQMESRILGKVGILFTKAGPFYHNRKLANEIKSITNELDNIKSDMANLHLAALPAEHLSLPMDRLIRKRETASFVNFEDVVGRQDDQHVIVEMLFDPQFDDKTLTVIPIVGFGGLGKTTLAQLVFNHARVKDHFDLTKWAYVPEKDNLNVILGKIYTAFTGNNNYGDLSLEHIKQGIVESIRDKKYLLVLDDIWDEGGVRLVDLFNLLKSCKQGSKVIVTTRSDVVARIVGTIDGPYRLGTLTDDQSWDLFKLVADKQGKLDDKNNSELIEIGKEIVNMCGNVPLAIKVVGGFLLSRTTENEWVQARDAQRSKAQLTKGNDIMDALKLSFDYLPSTLKQCFTYCSLFPKGYQLEKVELVYLWMAQGYFEPPNEATGDQLFIELLASGLFQEPNFSDDGDVISCKMHDLVYDLAQLVAGEETKLLGNQSPTIEQNTHDGLLHVNLIHSQIPQSLFEARRIRSLFTNECKGIIFSKFQYLRVLSTGDGEIEKVSNSIGRLVHLRYLEIKSDEIQYLPGSITRLQNLQTLKVERCSNLKKLPSDFVKLASLRHLILPSDFVKLASLRHFILPSDYNNDYLPSGFENLTSLQRLNVFIVEKSNGVDALVSSDLRGDLEIYFIGRRRNAILEAKEANLKNNDQLTGLSLTFEKIKIWPSIDSSNLTFKVDISPLDEMLMHLQLPSNLKKLEVLGYKGNEMPSRWLDGLSNLVTIDITFCLNCKVLPYMSQLRHLKFMNLERLDKLEYVEEEDNVGVSGGGNWRDATTNICLFPSLEKLALYEMPRLKGWTRVSSMGNGRQGRKWLSFPCLLEMRVIGCPKLMSMPMVAPKLENWEFQRTNGKAFEFDNASLEDEEVAAAAAAAAAASGSYSSKNTHFTSLWFLFMNSIKDASLSIGSRLCNLRTLRLFHCDELEYLRFESPNSIRGLGFTQCKRLRKIEGSQHLSFLDGLKIWGCEELEMEEEEEEEGNNTNTTNKSSRGWQWQNLTSLRSLELNKLPKWKKLPSGISCLTSLQKLSIRSMDNLLELPQDIGKLSQLQYLSISSMDNLLELPQDIGKLSQLRSVKICSCPELKSLPTSLLSLPSLVTLEIRFCPDLEERYEPLGPLIFIS